MSLELFLFAIQTAQSKPGSDIAVQFSDGAFGATVHGDAKPTKPAGRAKPKSTPTDRQGQLL